MKKVLLLAVVWLGMFVAASGSLAAEGVSMLEIGAKAPDFKLPGVDGKNYSLASFKKADVLVVVFTCNHCPTAQAYEDRIIKLTSDYKGKGVAVIAISSNDPLGLRLDELGYAEMGDTFEEMKIRARDKKFNFPYLYDGDKQQVARAYGPTSTPHVFIFGKKRTLRYVGRIDDSKTPEKVKTRDVRNTIDALLAGKEVKVPKTKAFGCSIKWSEKRELVKAAMEKWADEDVDFGDIDLAGVQKLLKNDTEKLLLVNFWATWCGPCVYEFPHLVTIHRMYRKRPFELITISLDDPRIQERVHSFLKSRQASTTNYLFNGDVYKLMEATDKDWQGSIPFTLIIKPGGEVLAKIEGMIAPLPTRKAIVEQLGRYN